ncbi:MAG: hypothetical protein JSS50_00390 [Proteobacteria bacterium]|nr:hypothetical protein [Pseudomonadota bacterium]
MKGIWKKLGNMIPTEVRIQLFKLYIKIMMLYYLIAIFLDISLPFTSSLSRTGRGHDSSKPFATTEQRRILRPQGRVASTRLQQSSWLSVLGMPAISYILEYEKYGVLRFSAPLFVLIIRSYLL